MPDPRRPHADEDGETVLFERSAANPPCAGCPYRQPPPERHAPLHGPSILPTPPLGDAALPIARPSMNPHAAPLPTPRPSMDPHAALPRPSLLVTPSNPGDSTLLLPDALKPAGPDAATVARPAHPGAPLGRAEPRRGFDELASPDITIMQAPAPAARPVQPPRRPARAGPDARAYFVLNLCLGLLIVAGLAILVTRQVSDTSQPGGAAHVTP